MAVKWNDCHAIQSLLFGQRGLKPPPSLLGEGRGEGNFAPIRHSFHRLTALHRGFLEQNLLSRTPLGIIAKHFHRLPERWLGFDGLQHREQASPRVVGTRPLSGSRRAIRCHA